MSARLTEHYQRTPQTLWSRTSDASICSQVRLNTLIITDSHYCNFPATNIARSTSWYTSSIISRHSLSGRCDDTIAEHPIPLRPITWKMNAVTENVFLWSTPVDDMSWRLSKLYPVTTSSSAHHWLLWTVSNRRQWKDCRLPDFWRRNTGRSNVTTTVSEASPRPPLTQDWQSSESTAHSPSETSRRTDITVVTTHEHMRKRGSLLWMDTWLLILSDPRSTTYQRSVSQWWSIGRALHRLHQDDVKLVRNS